MLYCSEQPFISGRLYAATFLHFRVKPTTPFLRLNVQNGGLYVMLQLPLCCDHHLRSPKTLNCRLRLVIQHLKMPSLGDKNTQNIPENTWGVFDETSSLLAAPTSGSWDSVREKFKKGRIIAEMLVRCATSAQHINSRQKHEKSFVCWLIRSPQSCTIGLGDWKAGGHNWE